MTGNRNRKSGYAPPSYPIGPWRLDQPAMTGPPITNVMAQTIANAAMLPHTSQLARSTDMSLSPVRRRNRPTLGKLTVAK
jgi:hypothetical protein